MKTISLKLIGKPHLSWLVIMMCATIYMIFFCSGCYLVGLPALLGTPTRSEAKTAAEFDVTRPKGQKILVLVEQPVYLNAYPGLRFLLTDMIINTFEKKAKVPLENIIAYDTLSLYRSETPDFSLLAPEQIGSAVDANLVLLVVVTDYRISQVGDTNLNNGLLDVHASIVKTETGEKLWPSIEPTKIIRVGFESKPSSPDTAAVHLAAAAAHCVTRHLYKCPKNKFKIREDRTGHGHGWD